MCVCIINDMCVMKCNINIIIILILILMCVLILILIYVCNVCNNNNVILII